jgi:hypothetical protein
MQVKEILSHCSVGGHVNYYENQYGSSTKVK